MHSFRNEFIVRNFRGASLFLLLFLLCGLLHGGEVYPLPDGKCPDGYRPVTRKKKVENVEGESGEEEEFYTVCLPLDEEELSALKEAQESAAPPSRASNGGDNVVAATPVNDRAQVTSEGATANLESSISIINDTQYKLFTNMDYRKRIIIVSSRNDQRFSKWWVLNYDPQIFEDIPTGRTVLYCSKGHSHTFNVSQAERIKFYASSCRLTTSK